MGALVVIITLCHLGWRGVLSDLVSLVRALGLWLIDIFPSPSDVLQVPDAILWRGVALLDVVVLVFPPSEVVFEGVLVLGARLC